MTRPAGYSTMAAGIGKFAEQMRDPDPANGRAAAREMRDRSGGKLVVFYTDHLSWPMATRVNQLADEIYGPRKEAGR